MSIRFSGGEDDLGRGKGEAEEAAPDEVPTAILDFTDQLFLVAVDELNAALTAIRSGRFDAAKDGQAAVRSLAAMGHRVLEERKNVDKLRKQVAGAVGAWGELDLEQARDEIGRRLACLRDARGD